MLSANKHQQASTHCYAHSCAIAHAAVPSAPSIALLTLLRCLLPAGLDFVFHMFFLVKYCKSLEEGEQLATALAARQPHSRPSDQLEAAAAEAATAAQCFLAYTDNSSTVAATGLLV
jgi:hypothetical protein